MTVIDIRTPAQKREDALSTLRRPLVRVLDWIADRPELVGSELAAALVTGYVGHDVSPLEVTGTIELLQLADSYITAADRDFDEAHYQQLVDAANTALDNILDAVFCGSCLTHMPDDAMWIVCPMLAESYCHDECHSAAHWASSGACFALDAL